MQKYIMRSVKEPVNHFLLDSSLVVSPVTYSFFLSVCSDPSGCGGCFCLCGGLSGKVPSYFSALGLRTGAKAGVEWNTEKEKMRGRITETRGTRVLLTLREDDWSSACTLRLTQETAALGYFHYWWLCAFICVQRVCVCVCVCVCMRACVCVCMCVYLVWGASDSESHLMYHAFISLVSDSETDGDLHLIESLSHALSYLLGLNNKHLNRVENIPGKLKCLFWGFFLQFIKIVYVSQC